MRRPLFLRRLGFIRGRPTDSDLGSAIGCTNLRLVKPASNGIGLNRAGRLVLRGDRSGQAVKIYEAKNKQHALFIQSVLGDRGLSSLFHKIISEQGSFLVAEWVTGKVMSEPLLSELADMQWRIHSASIDGFPEPGFSYWFDYIWPRFERASELLDAGELAAEVFRKVSECWNGAAVLMHPDITPRNIVRNPSGQWQIIDNELLSIGGMPLLDVYNTASSLGPEEREKYKKMYCEMSGKSPNKEEIEALNAAWLARKVGSMHVQGRLLKASEIIGLYKETTYFS